MGEVKVGIIGLDTSHTIEFTRRAQAPDCPEDHKVEGIKIINCMRFPSSYNSEEDQDKRQTQMEQWGVKVTKNIDEALEGVDAIMMEINNPALHLKYFTQMLDKVKGRPVFMDKPIADTFKNAKEIVDTIKKKQLKIFSASSLRFAPLIEQIAKEVPSPKVGFATGPLGKAPEGSSVVFYGVHTVEMLERIMGRGAKKVFAQESPLGVGATIEYSDGRRGFVQFNEKNWIWAALALDENGAKSYVIDGTYLYTILLKKIVEFFNGGDAPVQVDDTFEIQAILNAIDDSIASGKEQILG